MSKKCMDGRCPRNLEKLPDTWCPLGVQRLKALRHSGKELTEAEEASLPGCPWAVNHQMANYCFFKLNKEHMPDKRTFSSVEIAHFNSISPETISKVEKAALEKIRASQAFSDISETYGNSAGQDIEGMAEFHES